jgi:hypothetical protein
MLNFKINERQKPEVVADVEPENITPPDNTENEELIAAKQAQLDASQKKIKELETKLAQKGKEPKETPEDKGKKADLNTLLYQQLLDRVEAIFENPVKSQARVQELRSEIAAFLDTEFGDPAVQNNLRTQYDALNKSTDAPSVMVKGGIILERNKTQGDYSTVSISIADKETNEIVATYSPNPKTGKYLFILNPGKKYVITVKNTGFQTNNEDFSPRDSEESYEMNKDIRLKEK